MRHQPDALCGCRYWVDIRRRAAGVVHLRQVCNKITRQTAVKLALVQAAMLRTSSYIALQARPLAGGQWPVHYPVPCSTVNDVSTQGVLFYSRRDAMLLYSRRDAMRSGALYSSSIPDLSCNPCVFRRAVQQLRADTGLDFSPTCGLLSHAPGFEAQPARAGCPLRYGGVDALHEL